MPKDKKEDENESKREGQTFLVKDYVAGKFNCEDFKQALPAGIVVEHQSETTWQEFPWGKEHPNAPEDLTVEYVEPEQIIVYGDITTAQIVTLLEAHEASETDFERGQRKARDKFVERIVADKLIAKLLRDASPAAIRSLKEAMEVA